jgi:hypothetical protein
VIRQTRILVYRVNLLIQLEKRVKRNIPALALAAVLAWGPALSAQSSSGEQGIRVSHEALLAAVKSGNLTMAQALIHPQALGFYRESQMLVQLSGTYGAAEALPTVLADLGRFSIVPYDATYRVIGNTAVVCMSTNMQAGKSEKVKDRYLRSTYVYIRADGNWKLLSWHTSDTPLKQ